MLWNLENFSQTCELSLPKAGLKGTQAGAPGAALSRRLDQSCVVEREEDDSGGKG
jgi:hypothetical protein